MKAVDQLAVYQYIEDHVLRQEAKRPSGCLLLRYIIDEYRCVVKVMNGPVVITDGHSPSVIERYLVITLGFIYDTVDAEETKEDDKRDGKTYSRGEYPCLLLSVSGTHTYIGPSHEGICFS